MARLAAAAVTTSDVLLDSGLLEYYASGPKPVVVKNVPQEEISEILEGPETVRARFRPTAVDNAAPIVHLGGLVLQHEAGCRFGTSPSLHMIPLCSPQHSSRPFCGCLTPPQMDRSFAVELHERDLIVDAYYVVRGIAESRRLTVESLALKDKELGHILFKFEAMLHLYRLLAVVDAAGSSLFLRNWLADDAGRKAFHFRDAPEGDEEDDSSCDESSPAAAIDQQAAINDRRLEPFLAPSISDRSPGRSEAGATDDSSRISGWIEHSTAVTSSPRHALASVLRQQAATAPPLLTPPSRRATKRKAAAGAADSEMDLVRDVGLPTGPGAEAVPIQEYLRTPLVTAFPDAPLAQFSTDRSLGSLSARKWKRLHEGGTDFRVWVQQVPDSTAILFRMEGVVPAPVGETMSVLAEVETAKTWVPSITTPVKMGLVECTCMSREGRFDRTTRYVFAMPWPIKNRLAVLQGWLCDDIERNGSFTFCFRSFVPHRDASFSPLTGPFKVPSNASPLDFEGGAVLTPRDDNSVFLRMLFAVDPREKLPAFFLNFFTARFTRMAWSSFKRVCLAASKHKDLSEARESDRWLYDYVEERSAVAAELRREARKSFSF